MTPKRIVIVGGGISGLATAHRLSELSRARGVPLAVTLLEASDRLGGVIETRSRDGFLLESGPDAFITDKPWAVELCQRVGIGQELIPTAPQARRSFIVRKGKLVPVPEGFYLIAPARLAAMVHNPLLSFAGKLRVACEPFVRARTDGVDESVRSFIKRRFGREAFERVGQPMIGGIYTADPGELSLQAAMPRFWEMERRYGSILKGLRDRAVSGRQGADQASGPRYSLFMSLRGGVETLVRALGARLSDVQVKLQAEVRHVVSTDTEWTIATADGSLCEADVLCLAVPTYQAAALLRHAEPEMAQELDGIPYESVATVHVAFQQADLPRPLSGFGFVVPTVERRPLVGCTFSSVKFSERAPNGAVLVRAFLGGALHRDVMALSDGAMQWTVLQHLRELLGIEATPLFVSIRRYPKAMPQYHVGHLDRVNRIMERGRRVRGLYLTGNGYGGMGLPDCIRQGEETAERILSAVLQAEASAQTASTSSVQPGATSARDGL